MPLPCANLNENYADNAFENGWNCVELFFTLKFNIKITKEKTSEGIVKCRKKAAEEEEITTRAGCVKKTKKTKKWSMTQPLVNCSS